MSSTRPHVTNREQPESECVLILYASCRVLRWLSFFPCLHCLFLRGSVWGAHSPPCPLPPRRTAAAVLVQQRQQVSESVRSSPLFSPAPLSLPLPLSPRWRSPPRRPRPSSTDSVRMTASGPSGASLSTTCPGRSIKEKTERQMT